MSTTEVYAYTITFEVADPDLVVWRDGALLGADVYQVGVGDRDVDALGFGQA